MRLLKNIAVGALCGFLFCIVVSAYVAFKPNPFDWTEESRAVSVLAMFAGAVSGAAWTDANR